MPTTMVRESRERNGALTQARRGTISAPAFAPRPMSPRTPLDEALEERNALWADAVRARALAREVEAARALLALREASRSWRVTAPLRRLGASLQPLGPGRRGSRPTPSDRSSAKRS
jgi:hypothetical protein